MRLLIMIFIAIDRAIVRHDRHHGWTCNGSSQTPLPLNMGLSIAIVFAINHAIAHLNQTGCL
jgi:hypothetical protein